MKNALITGGAGGIGSAICRRFAFDGFRVFIGYNRSESEANALKDELCAAGADAYALKLDVASDEDIKKAAEYIEVGFGGLDILINNAGICQTKLFHRLESSEIDEMLSVNLRSVLCVTKAFLPQMQKKHGGSIINIASIWGETGASCEVHYSAAKAGIIGFTKALAKETGPCGIRVNCISPGAIDTAMLSEYDSDEIADIIERTPLERLGKPSDVANAAAFFASDKAEFITGQVLGVDGGFGR